MVRILKNILLALGVFGATCAASVIKGASSHEERLAQRELFYYWDIPSMSMPEPDCLYPPKSKKGSLKSPKAKSPKSKKGCKSSKSKGYYPPPPPGKGKGSSTTAPLNPGTNGSVTTTAPGTPSNSTPIPPTSAPGGINSLPPATTTPGVPGTSAPGTIPTSAPGGQTTTVAATNYQIAYTITQSQIPTTSDYDGVTTATSTYLNQAFTTAFQPFAPTVSFASSATMRTNQFFTLNQPVVVQYNTTVSFNAGSSIPSTTDLDAIVNKAFTTDGAAYQAVLTALTANIFSTTTAFTYSTTVQSMERGSTSTPAAAQIAGIAVAAGAGAFVLVMGAILVLRRRDGDDDDEHLVHKYNDGHMTVAGDTYAGTVSVDSGRESGMVVGGVGHQPTPDESGLTSSEWEGYAKFSTAEYRTTSPTSGHESDGSESSEDSIERPPRTLENVDI